MSSVRVPPMNENQLQGAGTSNYHGLHVTYLQRPRDWSSIRVTYALSKSMNNLGEAFFSSPTDPADVMKDWGRSDNDQRHRLVVSGSVNSPTTPARNAWEHVWHGFQASTMLQYYSSLPFNVVSGVNSLQGTAGRPFADGTVSTPNFDVRSVEFIPRNAGKGSDFFTLSLRVSRSFRLAGSTRIEGMSGSSCRVPTTRSPKSRAPSASHRAGTLTRRPPMRRLRSDAKANGSTSGLE